MFLGFDEARFSNEAGPCFVRRGLGVGGASRSGADRPRRLPRHADAVEQRRVARILRQQPIRTAVRVGEDRFVAPTLPRVPQPIGNRRTRLVPRDTGKAGQSFGPYSDGGAEQSIRTVDPLGYAADLGADVPAGDWVRVRAINGRDAAAWTVTPRLQESRQSRGHAVETKSSVTSELADLMRLGQATARMERSERSERPQRSQRHVVIVGGGFGGLRAAKVLRREALRVTLLDRHNYHLFQPLLYQVATGPDPIRWTV